MYRPNLIVLYILERERLTYTFEEYENGTVMTGQLNNLLMHCDDENFKTSFHRISLL